MKHIILIMAIVLFTSCAPLRSIGNNETYVDAPCQEDNKSECIEVNGKLVRRYLISLKSDGIVKFKDDKADITVDNTGQPGITTNMARVVEAIVVQKAISGK